MFSSVSNAVPNTPVSTRFTAEESCFITIPANPNNGVTVNGEPTLDTTIQLEPDDEIILNLTSPSEGEVVFYTWAYNGNPSYFAITSRSNQVNRTVRSSRNDLAWWEFPNPSPEVTYQGVNSDGILTYSIEIDDQVRLPLPEGREDILVFLEPSNNRVVFFYNIDGETDGLLSIPNNFHTLEMPSKPRSIARLLNNSTLHYDLYVLCEDGFIYRINDQFQITQSTVSHPSAAWVIVSDDLNLWVAGDQYLVRMSDMNTISQTIPTTEFITAGAASGPLVMFSAKGGRAIRVSGSQITPGHVGSWKGIPGVSNDRIWFPDPTNNRVIGYSARTAAVNSFQTIGSVASLPWAVGSNGDDLVISYLDETRVGFLPRGISFASERTLLEDVMFIGCSENWIIGSTYLSDVRFTNVSTPVISGPEFGYREGPQACDVGSGDFQVSSENDQVTLRIAPNTRVVADGQILPTSSSVSNFTFDDGTFLGVSLLSDESPKSTVVVLATQAFDYVVRGVENNETTSIINPGVLPVSEISSFVFDIPSMVFNAPIAVGAGTLLVNGSRHDGVTRVSEGDTIEVILRLRTTAPNRSTILSLADSQFALIANGRPEVELALETEVPISSTEVVSNVTITQAGSYHIPFYTQNVSIVRNGNTLFPPPSTSPISLNAGDELIINHVKSSAILDDFRRTYIIGPTTNFYVESGSFVDDEPDLVDFGIIPLLSGFPRLPALAPNIVTISGLTNGFSTEIFSDDPNVSFSVNGEDFEQRPLVQNGDLVEAQYIVRNLFDVKEVFTERSSGYPFRIGTIGIESPTEAIFLPYSKIFAADIQWDIFESGSSAHYQNDPIFSSFETVLFSDSPTSMFVNFDQMETDSPTGLFVNFDQMETDSPTGLFVNFDQMETDSPVGDFLIRGSEPTVILPEENFDFFTFSSDTLSKDILEDFVRIHLDRDSSFDNESEFESSIVLNSFEQTQRWIKSHGDLLFEKEWEEQKRENFRYFDPNFLFLGEVIEKTFDPDWQFLTVDIGDFAVRVNFEAFKDIFSILLVEKEYAIEKRAHFLLFDRESFVPNKSSFSSILMETIFVHDDQLLLSDSNGIIDSEKLWDTNLPLLTGGFPDEPSAFAAGQFNAGSLDFETYIQPEGSWSFIVNRETPLVCEAQPTSLRAVAWLLGGG